MADIANHPVLRVLDDMRETVASKAHDYADDDDVFSNFRGAATLAGVDVETVFNVLIGIKVERLRQLTSGKEPNHEGIEDTLLDLANYAALWLGFRREDNTMTQLVLNYVVDNAPISGYTMPTASLDYGVPI